MSTSTLPLLLRSMRLPTIAREYDQAIVRAEAENWGYPRFLSYLFEAEANDRFQRKVERHLKDANLPAGKTSSRSTSRSSPKKFVASCPVSSRRILSAAAITCSASASPAAARVIS